jgi:arginine repressor
MFNQLIELRTHGIQKLLIAASIGLFAVTATISSPGISRAEVAQTATSDALLQKQSEIDSYVFEKHADELEKQGIHVTNTGAVGNVVEIGITDYTDEKANYLYGIFGKDLVKVVEGQQAVLFGSSTGVATTATAQSGTLLQKQSEIDSYVFEKHADEMEKQGIHVTNTGVVGNVVEIGITDYTDEKANYLYGLFGKDLVKVVEGQQAVPLNNNGVGTASVGNTTTDVAGSSASQYVLWAVLLAAVVAIGALFSRKLRVSKK